MAFIRKLGAFASQLADLLSTLRPGHPGVKLMGSVSHAGGPQTKAGQIARFAAKKGEPYGALLCLSSVRLPLAAVRVLRLLGARVITIQNGVYYPLWYKGDFRAANRYLKKLNDLSHHSFFQSEFALRSYRRWVGSAPASHSILYNGVDVDFFRPVTAENEGGILFFLDLKEMNRSTWREILSLLEALSASPSLNKLKIRILGHEEKASPIRREVEERLSGLGLDFSVTTGASREQLMAALGETKVMIHLTPNDVCPNKVLEALAAGVWVIGNGAGGTKELLPSGGPVSFIETPESFDQENYPELARVLDALKAAIAEPRSQLQILASGHAAKFSLESWWGRVSQQARLG